MAQYLLELYASQGSAHDAERLAAAVAASDDDLRYLRTILVPGDETCFCLIEAPSASALANLAEAAGVEPERIVEAVTD